jgi:probable HAF family extracellular repeat protein
MNRRVLAIALGITAALGGVAGGVLAVDGSGSSGSSNVSLSANSQSERMGHMTRLGAGWTFNTLNNSNDVTFNQLLGINNRDQIAGYFGSGAKGHPNKGYVLNLSPNGSSFQNENFPLGVQTQVIGINDTGVTVGFWSTQNKKNMSDNNFGFYDVNGQFHNVVYPGSLRSKPPVTQLLGVNDADIAVGFFNGPQGNAHAFEFSIRGHWFRRLHIPGAVSSTATGINNRGEIVGFFTTKSGATKGFVITARGAIIEFSIPRASSTMAFGVNDFGEIVGTFMRGSGNNAKSFGFTWKPGRGYTVVNDPLGSGATTLNGINNAGDLVGFYTDAKGNTDGLLVAHGTFTVGAAPPVTSTGVGSTGTGTTTTPVPSAGPTHF